MTLSSTWFRTLVGGAAVYALVTVAAISTANIHLVPVVLVLGALLVPVTFVICLFERLSVQLAVMPAVAVCFAAPWRAAIAAPPRRRCPTYHDALSRPHARVAPG